MQIIKEGINVEHVVKLLQLADEDMNKQVFSHKI
jgi:hypothetical protein